MDNQIKEILGGKPAEFKNGVHTILFDLLVKHPFNTQAYPTDLINNNDELHDDFRKAFPSDIDGKTGPNFISKWRAGKIKVTNGEKGRAKLEFFSKQLFPGIEVHQLYNNDILSDYGPLNDRAVRKCMYCKKPELVDSKGVHVTTTGQLYHRRCARKYNQKRYQKRKEATPKD
ncbi:MAG: hypothetical protein PVG35_21660 [Desulfobacterales bacterium]|jgi:hypothetical protein